MVLQIKESFKICQGVVVVVKIKESFQIRQSVVVEVQIRESFKICQSVDVAVQLKCLSKSNSSSSASKKLVLKVCQSFAVVI